MELLVDVLWRNNWSSIFENGKVIYTADEATGGTQLSLVVAGAYKIPFGRS